MKTNMRVTGANNKKSSKKEQLVKVPRQSVIPGQRAVLTFSTTLALAESAAQAGNYWFYRMNSVYDPDASGVGAVAIGYNTWAALFLNYKVRKVTLRAQGVVTGLSTGSFGNVVFAPVPNQMVIPANKQTWKVIPRSVLKTVTQATDGGRNMFMVERSYELHQLAGVTREQYRDDMDFSGAVGSNPARQIYLVVTIDSTGSTTAATLTSNVQLSYEVEWFNPTPMQ